ncbi:MAG TPA: nucleotidyltransferase domain-containing protein [Azospirillum sp.]|nr:nucleotidyltransferase domain-containing protein [Azospirillum sp.]
MPEAIQPLSELDLIGVASALARAMGRRVMPADVVVLAVAPALTQAFDTDEFAVAARAHGRVFALSGSEDGWSVLDAEEMERWVATIEHDLDLLRNVRRAAFEAPEVAATPKVPEDVQRWVSPVSGWHNDGPPTDNLLQVAVEAIVETTKPQAVYLIGSLARGDAQPDSDIDLFVIVGEDAMPQPVVLQRLRQSLREHGVLFDVRACRRLAFEANREEPGTMAHSVAREGVLLYGAEG